MKPTVSIVIPTYNRADFLADAIMSVLDQELFKGQTFEVILVDDGSTDGTGEIIKQFGDKIRYYKLPHSGLPARARNFGITKARANLIAFQDSDDLWVPDKLNQQIPAFDDPQVVLCYGNGLVMEANGKLTKDLIVPHSHLKSGYVFPDLLEENFISTLTVVVKKSCLLELGGFNESILIRGVEDFELWLRISGLKLGKFKAIKKTLAYYRRHGQNVSNESINHPLQDVINAQKCVLQKIGQEMAGVERRILENSVNNHQKNLDEHNRISTPLVSVVMSVYNAGDFLEPAIQSVLNQTYTNFEFIIVDDGSKDNSWKTIKNYSDKRIKAFRQNNQGIQAGLNAGISRAKGKYIARMDQDDLSLRQRLEKQVHFLESHDDIAIVGTNFPLIGSSGKVINHSFYLDRPEDLKLEVFLRNPFGHGTVMVRRSVFDKVGIYNQDEPVEDWELWWRIMQKFDGSNLVEELYKWRVLPSSMSHGPSADRQVLIHKLVKKIWQQTPLPPVPYKQIKSGLVHYAQYSPDYGGQFMFMLSTLCLGAFRMRRYVYATRLLFKLLIADRLFVEVLRSVHKHQVRREYLLVHIHHD